MSATASPATEVTLKDLYNAIPWERIAESEGRWLRQTSKKVGDFDPSDEFREKFRCVLLDEALYGKDETIKADAQMWLKRAGVWPNVVAFLMEHGLIEEDDHRGEPES